MAEGMRFEERMSDMDALMWGIEKDPLLRSTITAVALLDRAPDRDRLLDKIRRGLVDIPRLTQRAVPAPFNVGPPRWITDPDFTLDYHVRWLRAPGAGTERDLLDLAQPIAMQSFDRARPLWEFVVVDGLADGRAALIQKVHHSVTDGIGGVKLALMLLDMERDPAPPAGEPPAPPPGERPSAWRLLTDALEHERRRQLGIAVRSVLSTREALRDPGTAVRRVQAVTASAVRMLAPNFNPLSPVMIRRSLSVRFDVLQVPMDDLKAAARAADARLNDAFVAAITGGMARYHERLGEPVDALRMAMPISIRPSGAGADGDAGALAGNQFVPARFPVPLAIGDPVERMQAVRALVGAQRAEPALSISEPVAGVLNRLPLSFTTALFGGMLRGVDFIASNVPGAPFQVFLAGAALEANYAFGPLSGSAVNITLLSNADELHIGVNSDPAAVPDPAMLLECLEEGFEEVRKSA